MTSGIEENREIALLNLQVQTFHRVDRFISSIYNLEELLDLIMREAAAAVAAEASCIAVYDPLDSLLHIEFASGEADEGVMHLSLAAGQGILGTVAITGRALKVDDVGRDPRFDPSIDRRTGFTTKSIVAAPILWKDELLAVLEVINKRDGASFTEEDTLMLEVVANQAAVAIENAWLFERIVHSKQLSVIGRLAASIIRDLKQSMTVIRAITELLGNPEMDPQKGKTFSNLILADVDRFLEKTEELLEYSRETTSLQSMEVHLRNWLACASTGKKPGRKPRSPATPPRPDRQALGVVQPAAAPKPSRTGSPIDPAGSTRLLSVYWPRQEIGGGIAQNPRRRVCTMAGASEENRAIALLNLQIQTFYRVNRFISSIYNLEELLDLAMREAEAAVAAEASCIALYDPADNLLHIEFASGEAEKGVRHLTLPMGRGILGEVAATKKPLRVGDVRLDPRHDATVDRQTGFTTKSILAAPILRRDELLGVLEVFNKKGGPVFTEEDSLLLEVVANQAAVAIENARLLERIV